MESRNEVDLVSRAQAGDKAAFEALLEPLIASAASLAYAMLQDRAEAEDVVQESAVVRHSNPGFLASSPTGAAPCVAARGGQSF